MLLLVIFFTINAQAKPHSKPSIQQAVSYKAVSYKAVADISQYWLSEKLDGMRGYWDGKRLVTRQGSLIHSPKRFTKGWPDSAIDGELWIKRGEFQSTISCVRKIQVDESCWQKVRFMIFDLPKHHGTFTQRILSMKELVKEANSPYLSIIRQFKISTIEQLNNTLNNVVKNNGEGLMLHHGDALYHVGRSTNIMKLKAHEDAEAIVIAHTEGKGKYKGLLGAIKVKTMAGVTFKIGSGFTDKERIEPPKIGSLITFKYNGKTEAGIPRFARFYRVRKQPVEPVYESSNSVKN